MDEKQIGAIILIIGILLGVFIYMAKAREDNVIKTFVKEQGTCYLEDGTCLHDDRNYTFYIFGGVLSAGLIVLGIYLYFFDKSQEILKEHQVKISSALQEAKKHEKDRDEFSAFLGSFNEGEKKVLKAIYEQDGILQSTLRYRTDMSKTSLSLILKSFEEKKLISKEPSGKTNKIHFIKKF